MADVAVVAVALTGLTAACYAFRMWQERRQTHVEPPKPVGQSDTGQGSSSARDVVRVVRDKPKRRPRGEQPPLLEVPVSLGLVVKQGEEAPIEELLKPELKVEAWLNGLTDMAACGGELFEGEVLDRPRSARSNRSPSSRPESAEPGPRRARTTTPVSEPEPGARQARATTPASAAAIEPGARASPPVSAAASEPEPVITIKEAVRDSTEHPRTMLNSSARQVEASLKFLRRHASTTSRSSGSKLLARPSASQQRRPPVDQPSSPSAVQQRRPPSARASPSTVQQHQPSAVKNPPSTVQQRRTPVAKASPSAAQQRQPSAVKPSSPNNASPQRRLMVVKASPSTVQQRRTPVVKASPSTVQQRRVPVVKASPSTVQQRRTPVVKASPSTIQQRRTSVVKASPSAVQQRQPPAAKRVEPPAVRIRRLQRVVMVKPAQDCATVALGPARRRPANYVWRSVAPVKARTTETACKPPRSISEVMDPDHVFDGRLTDSEPEHFRVTDLGDLMTSASDRREREREEGEEGGHDAALLHVQTQGFRKLIMDQTDPDPREKQHSETRKL